MENFIIFSPWASLTIAHVLSLGAACMFAGLLYFCITTRQINPKYRIANYLGAVVMVSAALELANQYIVWKMSMQAIPGADGSTVFAATGTSIFSNGYRYVNWSIDVPVLLTQIVVVLGLSGKKFWSPVTQFTAAGLLMIYTGYIGQYFEAVPGEGIVSSMAAFVAQNPAEVIAGTAIGEVGQTATYWIMFVVSCVFYLWILALVFKVGLSPENMSKLPPKAQYWMKVVVWTLVGSWMLYLVGYLMPAISISEESAVIRQSAYTVADVVSKVIYGIMISYVAQLRSESEGYTEVNLDRMGFEHNGNGSVAETRATTTV